MGSGVDKAVFGVTGLVQQPESYPFTFETGGDVKYALAPNAPAGFKYTVPYEGAAPIRGLVRGVGNGKYLCGQNEMVPNPDVIAAIESRAPKSHKYTTNTDVDAAKTAVAEHFGLRNKAGQLVTENVHVTSTGSCGVFRDIYRGLLDPLKTPTVVSIDTYEFYAGQPGFKGAFFRAKIKILGWFGVTQQFTGRITYNQPKSAIVAFMERTFAISEAAAQQVKAVAAHIYQPFVVKGQNVTSEIRVDEIAKVFEKNKPDLFVLEVRGNPSAHNLTLNKVKEIIALAKQHNVTIIFDAPYHIYGKQQQSIIKYVTQHIIKNDEHMLFSSISKIGGADDRGGIAIVAKKFTAQIAAAVSFAEPSGPGMRAIAAALSNPNEIQKLDRYAGQFVNTVARSSKNNGFLFSKGSNFVNIYGLEHEALNAQAIRRALLERGIVTNVVEGSYGISAVRISPPDEDYAGFKKQFSLAMKDLRQTRARLVSEGATELAWTKGQKITKAWQELFPIAGASKFGPSVIRLGAVALVTAASAWLFTRGKDEWSKAA